MTFYAGKIIQHPALANPTLVVLTDPQRPGRPALHPPSPNVRNLLRADPPTGGRPGRPQGQAAGGLRRHRLHHYPEVRPRRTGRRVRKPSPSAATSSSLPMRPTAPSTASKPAWSKPLTKKPARRGAYTAYGFAKLPARCPAQRLLHWLYRHPHRSHRQKHQSKIFGDYIDIYDIQRAVEDGATVKNLLRSPPRPKSTWTPTSAPTIDPDFEDVTEGEELSTREKLKSKWAQLESHGRHPPKRLSLVAADLVQHFENRLAAMDGKGLIVCMSRRICVDLYKPDCGPAPRLAQRRRRHRSHQK